MTIVLLILLIHVTGIIMPTDGWGPGICLSRVTSQGSTPEQMAAATTAIYFK